ncbi:HupE/UreJ family protein [Paenibacillus solisilvae]|uniref:HupE/UreJ family protein n=1 Tax=Paenibacillus solisilvae TaxID=2486751 RepID=A0ABW0W8I5_9BACL
MKHFPKWPIVLVFILLGCSIWQSPTSAHFQTFGYSDITIQNTTIRYSLELDPYEVMISVPELDSNQNSYVEDEEVAAATDSLFAFVQSNLSATNDGETGTAILKGTSIQVKDKFPLLRFDFEFQFTKPIDQFELNYRFFFDKTDPQHQNFATVRAGDRSIETVIQQSHHVLTQADIGQKSVTVQVPNWLHDAAAYVGIGMKHIWSGFDHMLFLAALIIGGGSKRDYLKMLTAFTLGHSVTLALSVLEIVTISPKIIEPLIALSIVYTAAENMFRKNLQYRWLVTLLFGLVHGFGFSYILQGKLTGNYALSLFSFNLGVEIGQLAVLAVLLPVVWVLARKKWLARAAYGASAIVGAAGLYWLVERVVSI